MDAIVPWNVLCAVIEPYYAKTPENAGRRSYPLESMLRIHLMQHWFELSDPGMESELYDSMAMRKFAKLGSLDNPTPDETTIQNHQRTVQISEGSIQRITKKCRSYLYEMRSRKSLSIQKASIVKGVVRPNGSLGAIRGLPELL